MAACNMDNGRHRNAARARQELAGGERVPVTGAKTTVKLFNPTGETPEQRKARHAQATGTRPALWK
jgi:hypothetical protein